MDIFDKIKNIFGVRYFWLSISKFNYFLLDGPELVFLVCPARSRLLAWDSEMMEAVTTGGDMCTLSLVPTSSRMVALNRVFVFRTCTFGTRL